MTETQRHRLTLALFSMAERAYIEFGKDPAHWTPDMTDEDRALYVAEIEREAVSLEDWRACVADVRSELADAYC